MAYRHHDGVAMLLRLGEWARGAYKGEKLRISSAGVKAIRDRFRYTFRITNAQSLLHAIAQSLASEGFGKKVIGARAEGVSARNLPAHSRDEHDRNSRRHRAAPEDFTNRKAIDVRQPHVQEDQIGRMTVNERQTVCSGFRGENFEACFLQVILNEFDEVRFIVNHQNPCRHVKPLAQGECAEQRRDSESTVTKWRRQRQRERGGRSDEIRTRKGKGEILR
jgi:hypothetical protein